ncbi:MAG TPA: Crp/Fnr family transcriptional regulator [Flavisolibacter sp.]|nr:Crp/Fnr family transcriptional regulator [Flavisolibacter sp.]
MATINNLQLLRQSIERFVKLPDSDWNLLLPHIQLKGLKKHQLFAKEGRQASDVAFVIDGTFRHFYTRDGEEKTTYFYFPDDLMCSYFSCISGKPSLITLQALTDSSFLCFPYKVLLDLYQQSHAWQTFGRLIAEYIATGLEERMVGLLLQSPESRYRELLTGTKKKIIERIPQQYIASYLGITPVSMSRIRARLTAK